ncbi:MAG: formate dehydrogenase subunit gamma [Alphaproteobacteria bacterium]|nr:formate dehydrogenase subunit gamma [Alphaproteobacteria bacterium]
MTAWLKKPVSIVLFAAALLIASAALIGSPHFSNPAAAQSSGQVPGQSLGNSSDAELWRAIRKGKQGNVSIQDKQAGVMIQSEGESWRSIRNGPLSTYGAWAVLGIIALLALFFTFRGRIRVDAGLSGLTVERFNATERFAHWLVANSFIVLALTGLNLLYGRYVLKPFLGPEFFSTLTQLGKYAHNYVAFAFILGLVMILVLWIKDNIPNKEDLSWLAKGGGLFTSGSHPPAKRFNAGQKIVFWVVVLGGLSISLSGIALLFPFKIEIFAGTFAILNIFGFGLPTELTPMQEMQYSQIWHAIVAFGMIVLIIAHIYIATIGMEGAYDAMGTGQVDRNWAKEHHRLWVEGEEPPGAPGDD